MTRRLFTIASAFSLLLCVATAGLWVWSYRVADLFTRKEGHYPLTPNGIADPHDPEFHQMHVRILVLNLQTNCGTIHLSGQRSIPSLTLGPDNLPDWQPDYPDGVTYRWEQDEASPESAGQFGNMNRRVLFDRGGFRYESYAVPSISTNFMSFTAWEFACPIWFVLVLTAVLPAVSGVQRRSRRKRLLYGLCLSCGYDLRASNDRCPECGTAPPRKIEARA